MKNVSRSKCLLCFRPVVDMDLMLESEAVVVARSQNQALTYVGVKNREDTEPSKAKSFVSDTKNSILIHRPGKKTFSKLIKAVVFEIILAKRGVRDREGVHQVSYSSKQGFRLSSRDRLLDTTLGKTVNKVQDTISKSNSVSSISSCSSSSSSASPNSTLKPEGQKLQNDNTYSKHQESEVKPNSSSNSAILLLLAGLAVTIFWGKICAILFTSIWLYFLPHQQPAGVGYLENTKTSLGKNSRNNKKKVIMEGLLERNHNRGEFNFCRDNFLFRV